MQPGKGAVSLGILLVAASSGSAQVYVPGDYATIQDAIDSVAAGTVIVVNGGTYDAIVIDKAVTLVGDPMPTIDNSSSETVPFVQDTSFSPLSPAGPQNAVTWIPLPVKRSWTATWCIAR